MQVQQATHLHAGWLTSQLGLLPPPKMARVGFAGLSPQHASWLKAVTLTRASSPPPLPQYLNLFRGIIPPLG